MRLWREQEVKTKMEDPVQLFGHGRPNGQLPLSKANSYKLGVRSAPKKFGTHLNQILLCKSEASNLKPVLVNSFAPSLA